MLKIIKSLMLVCTSTVLMAGGTIAPTSVEDTLIEDTIVTNADYAFYVGAAYAYTTIDEERLNDSDLDHDNGFLVNAGYNYNENIAVELRYTQTSGDANDNISIGYDVSNIALYVKPQYEIVDNLNIYALLGYGQTDMADITSEAFQWGAGLSYDVTEELSIFVDYTNLNDGSDYEGRIYDLVKNTSVLVDSVDSINTVNVGVSYRF